MKFKNHKKRILKKKLFRVVLYLYFQSNLYFKRQPYSGKDIVIIIKFLFVLMNQYIKFKKFYTEDFDVKYYIRKVEP